MIVSSTRAPHSLQDADMWADAMRIVKEYLPNKLDEFQKEMSTKSGKYVRLCS